MNQVRVALAFVIFATLFAVAAPPAQNNPNQDPFPEVVQKIRKSLALVRVGTELDGVFNFGTAFILTSRHDSTFLASAHHIFFKPSKYYKTKIDSAIIVHPDTSKIEIKLDVDDSFRPASIATLRKDKDIVILKALIPTDSVKTLDLKSAHIGDVEMIREGTSVASTGYNLIQRTVEFNQLQYWPTTYRGVISSVRSIGPDERMQFINQFQVDMLLNHGASGSPIYRPTDGEVLGMFNEFKGNSVNGVDIPLGLAYCIPAWAIGNCFADYLRQSTIPDSTDRVLER